VVLQVPMIRRDVAAGTVTYVDPDTNEEVTTPVTGGNVKCQWKADWAMRWAALGIDYEMAGKDLIDSVKLSSRSALRLAARRRKASTMSSSSTTRAARSPSRRATA
jgi:lysyl-tRNA synthetase class 1